MSTAVPPLLLSDARLSVVSTQKQTKGSSPFADYNSLYLRGSTLSIPYNFITPEDSKTVVNYPLTPFNYIRVSNSFVGPGSPYALVVNSFSPGVMWFLEVVGVNDIALKLNVDSIVKSDGTPEYRTVVVSPGCYFCAVPAGIPPMAVALPCPLLKEMI